MRAAEVEIRETGNREGCLALAASLPDYFSTSGLNSLKNDLACGALYGALLGNHLAGFALYRELNAEAVELSWLAVERGSWSQGIGTRLVIDSLAALPRYRLCEVKTLAATVPDAGYARTRRFYGTLGFIPLEVIDPYPGWEPGNPCLIMVRCL